ncbi:hypothetical protein [Agrilutibacter solisilvae]|uniref:Uncharacterized protein n=1 Tax=Agrilutibacter solisilvae TaxID=2763317 RepID=A0A974XXP7_9GAMM|nr:hypothetical protein [Lysobacter solisilvae]QSX77691.1 hypothetical protein I8J32_013210 [Lysobacter solisilvae]
MADARKIVVDPSAVAWRLGLMAAVLVVTSIGMQMYRLAAGRDQVPGLAWVTLDGEHNIPALFSTLLLLAAALLLALVARLARDAKAGDVSKWVLLALGFFFMGIDESMSVHERLIDPMRNLLGGRELGIFFFAWVVPAIVLVGGLALYFLPFVFRLPRTTAVAFVASGALYLGGALGVELVEGWWREGHGHVNVMYHVLVTLEESLEMAGVIFFIRALLGHIATCFGDLHLHLRPAAEAVSSQAADSDATNGAIADTSLLPRGTGS